MDLGGGVGQCFMHMGVIALCSFVTPGPTLSGRIFTNEFIILSFR